MYKLKIHQVINTAVQNLLQIYEIKFIKKTDTLLNITKWVWDGI